MPSGGILICRINYQKSFVEQQMLNDVAICLMSRKHIQHFKMVD